MGFALGILGHVHQAQHLFDAGVDFAGRQTVLLEAEGNVLRNRHVREQSVRLEHHVDRPLVRRHVSDVHAIEENPPIGRALEACEHAQQGRFAGTGTAEQSEDFALMNLKRDIVYCAGFVELLGDAVDFQQHLFRCLLTFKSLPVSAGGVCHVKLPTGFSRRANAA
jgi:hypothetical protein